MTLLIPLGLLGLLGIVALIVIYIIRPNYQQKTVSSTYVWKLSLKYRKKKLPTDRIRNLLLLICQILILALITWILTKPVTVINAEPLQNDVIAVIDSSASMYAGSDGETRYERAVNGAIDIATKTFDNNGLVSVIVADANPSYLAKRVPSSGSSQLIESLNKLLASDNSCSYGASDVDAALKLCEEVLDENPSAEIYLYTDTEYTYVPDDINLVQVDEKGEWNVGILDVEATQNEDATYAISVDVAAYGSGCNVKITLNVVGADALDSTSVGKSLTFEQSLYCYSGVTQKVIFTSSSHSNDNSIIYSPISSDNKFYSYQTINVYLTILDTSFTDAFDVDNTFALYGGQKQVLKVEYASSLPNDFFPVALDAVKNHYSKNGLWDVQVTDVKAGDTPATEGFDVYIFEHTMPETLPTDGVVLLVDPDTSPAGSGLRLQSTITFKENTFLSLVENESHPLTQYINADDIYVSKYVKLAADPIYSVLMTCNGDPAILVCNEVTEESATQIAVIAFSVHYSNLSYNNGILATLMANLFEYFIPSTVTGNAYDVNETITLNARGKELTVTDAAGINTNETFTSFPTKITLSLPGTYIVRQTTYFGRNEESYIYVKIPSSESNVCRTEDGLTSPNRAEQTQNSYEDWLVYLAAALVALIFIEWILKSHENV